jgi:hypothetical protein
MPLLSSRRVLAAKIETAAGTAIATTTTDAFFAMDVKITPEIMYTERPDDATLGQRTGIVGAKKGKCTFKIELKGSGTAGTSPTWAEALLPACGLKETTGAWKPSSNTSDWKTVTIVVYEDGVKKSICGAMGTFKGEGDNGKPVYLNFEFEGVWVAPVDGALVVPEADTVKPQPFIGSTFTLGAAIAPVAKFSFDLGNKIYVREDITNANGYLYAVITERAVSGKIDPEATLIATRNYFNEFISETEAALSLATSGTTPITIAAPKAQYKAMNEGDRTGIVTNEIEFVCNKSAAAGDDEFSITF